MNASVVTLFDRLRPNRAASDCAQAERIICERLHDSSRIVEAIKHAKSEIRRGSAVSLAVHRAMSVHEREERV
jgi:hypothetical protein